MNRPIICSNAACKWQFDVRDLRPVPHKTWESATQLVCPKCGGEEYEHLGAEEAAYQGRTMTNPTPGADSERAAFEAWVIKMFGYDVSRGPRGHYSTASVEMMWLAHELPRAAAKVGANVAADELDDLWISEDMDRDAADSIASLPRKQLVAYYKDTVADKLTWRRRALEAESRIASGAPAETPKPAKMAVELVHIKYQLEQGAGFWHSCSGCHDTEDGHPTGNYSYSNEMRCALGNGCSECGGLGAVWDNNDYSEAAGDFLFAQPVPAPIAGDVEKDAARYRWLREHFEDVFACNADGELAVAVKAFGHDSDNRLNVAIDAAMLAPTSSAEAG